MRAPRTPEERRHRDEWIKRTLGGIPASDDWPQAFVALIEDMIDSEMDVLLAPPMNCSAEDRLYNAGRSAAFHDVLARLEQFRRALHADPRQVRSAGTARNSTEQHSSASVPST
jgi:hypothetical protein